MKKNNKILLTIIFFVISAVIVYAVTALGVLFFTNVNNFSFKLINVDMLKNPTIWIIFATIVVGVLIFTIINLRFRGAGRALKVNYGEDAHWLASTEMKQQTDLIFTKFSMLDKVKDGIPIMSEQKGNDLNIIMSVPIHTLVIGTTGSGKTSAFVSPVIQILSKTKTKPCLIITDPKEELYDKHAKGLADLGYKIYVIDLRNIYQSSHWNPFNTIWEKTDRMKTAAVTQNRGQYFVDGNKFLTYEEAELARRVYVQQLVDDVYIDLQDIIYTICPIENKHDTTWQQGARDLILGLALAFWEDVRDGLMSREQFNLYNLYKNISLYCTGEMPQLKAYFDGRGKFSKAPGLANTVTVSQDRTLTSYMGDINRYFNWLADNGINSLMSKNDIDLTHFDDEPSALFLKIPDERENRHKVVTLFVTQIYKTLVEKASLNKKKGFTKDSELRRNCYIIMDEFGNMPKFNSIDNIITVGRSRHIFMIPIIQDFAQLDNKYGKETASIIKSNCNIKVFIGSTDKNTLNEFSELCGKHKTKNVSFSDAENSMNISTGLAEKPLIYPSELEILNSPPKKSGNAIVLMFGKSPLKSKYTPIYLAPEKYEIKTGKLKDGKIKLFDESAIFYDITLHNRLSVGGCIKDNDIDNSTLVEETDEELFEEMKRIWENIEAKEMTLHERLPADSFSKLWNADLLEKVNILDDYFESAIVNGDNFLSYDIVKVKNYIENICREGTI